MSVSSATDAIRVTGLRHGFGEVTAVDGIDLTVGRGEVFGLLGPDGAGKSTLIRLIATVLTPGQGDVEVFGDSVRREPGRVKPHIGYMSQRFSLYGDLTVRENVDFFARLRGVPRAQRALRAERALGFAGLAGFQNRQAQYLSGGMKQKLALAVTLMHEPDLLLLDEPTTGVDPVSRREFWRIIADLHRSGITVIVATPYMDEAERCNRVAFMDRGRISVCDTPAALKERVEGALFEIGSPRQRAALAILRTADGVRGAMMFGDTVRALMEPDGPGESELRALLESAGVPVESIAPAHMDMETAFSFLVTRERDE